MKNPIPVRLKTELVPLSMIALSIIISVLFYNYLPDTVVTHWGINGEPDGFGPKTVNLIAPPLLMTAMYLLFLFLPRLDPNKERYNEFQREYLLLRSGFLFFFLLVFFVSNLFNAGYPIQINQAMPVMIGLLFMFIGNYLAKVRQNWFLGIKTPWTLSSEKVWQKTHRLGGWLFVLLGLALILSTIFIVQVNWIVMIIGVAVVVLIPFIYSYILFKKEKK